MLAAGMGKRLGSYTKNATKCMVPVNGKTLIEYAIETLVKNNIKKMVIVVGYKSDVLIDFIHSKFNKKNMLQIILQLKQKTRKKITMLYLVSMF